MIGFLGFPKQSPASPRASVASHLRRERLQGLFVYLNRVTTGDTLDKAGEAL
jgi:hypothetical protein